jgi:ABC-2 type transport system ATP-binding protein
MEQVEEICDHIILMNQGKKILDGTVKDVKQKFKENLFAITLDHIPLEPAPDSFEIISTLEQKLVVKIRDGYRPNDVLLHYLQKDITITGFYELLPSMNDIFIRLVEGTPLTRQFQKLTA